MNKQVSPGLVGRRAAVIAGACTVYLAATLLVTVTTTGCGNKEAPAKAGGASTDEATATGSDAAKRSDTTQRSDATQQGKSAPELPPLPPPPESATPLRLVISGMMDGHLEPCGCASAQAGGGDRRAFWLQLNRHRYDAKLEGGNAVHADNPLERQKLQWIQTILGGYLEYKTFPLGPRDLALGPDELTLYSDAKTGAPFVCTDLRVEGKAPFQTFAIETAAAYKVCILSLAGKAGSAYSAGATAVDAKTAVSTALAAAGKRGTDYHCVVLFAHDGGPETARDHARKLHGIDLVLSFEDNLETRGEPELFRHDPQEHGVALTTLLYPGWRGKNLLLWTGKPDAASNWHTVGLDKEVLQVPTGTEKGKRPSGSDAEVWSMLIASKQEIGELGLREAMAERKPRSDGLRYVGSSACKDCHVSATKAWEASKHSHAWATLVEREKVDGWPVSKHPDCVSCHAVGYGEVSGFVNPDKTKDLAAVGCEACHGPASKHIEVMSELAAREATTGKKASSDEVLAASNAGRLQKADARGCTLCHNFEQSPGFDFLERWPKIKHGLDR